MTPTITDIEKYFTKNGIPKEPWRIDKGSICVKPELMVKTHIATWKMYEGNYIFFPYRDRLVSYYLHCKKQTLCE